MKQYTIKKIYESAIGISAVISREGEEDEILSFKLSVWADEGLKTGAVFDEYEMDRLRYLSDVCKAMVRGEAMLGYSDHSKKRLAMRLVQLGFERDVASDAAHRIEAAGLINEADQAERLCREYVRYKNWGKKRIAAELTSKGYEKNAILYGLSFISDDEFRSALSRLISQKYKNPPADRRERDKRVAALMRLGHNTGDIIRAMRENYESDDF